jgi:acetylornithine deacetylase/succinyl-diaminopimelate desuccinylase-like protein
MSIAGAPDSKDRHHGCMTTADQLSPDPHGIAARVIERTIALCTVPAPPLREQERARIVRDWWAADGLDEISIDGTGNLRARLRAGESDRPCVLVCAHLDTVFDPEVTHGVTRDGGRLIGPGVGDNTIAVCSLSALDTLLPPRLRHPLWVVATVGEEGLGNLAGVRALLDDAPAPIRAVVAIEGNYLGRVNVVGVGSTRWRVTVTGPGGHAWEDADRPSAVHTAAHLITQLAELADLGTPRATVNIGRFEGGESVNSRAERATFLVDLRSGDAATLQRLCEAATAILDGVAAPMEVSREAIGDRPAGALDSKHPLATLAVDILREHGIPPLLTAASTDANAAYALGIPAVTLGITTGDGTHTEQEWIDVDPVGTGLTALAATLARLDEQEW